MSILREFWDWWTGELASFWPRQDMRRVLLGRSAYEANLSKHGAKLLAWRGKKSHAKSGDEIGTFADLESLLVSLKKPSRIVVSLDESLILRRNVQLPVRIRRREIEMLELDAEHSTPFKRGEFLSIWRGTQGRIEHAVLRRNYFETIAQLIARSPHKLAGLSVRLNGQEFWPNVLAANGKRLGESQFIFWRKLTFVSAGLVAAVWFGTMSFLNAKVESTRIEIEQLISAKQPKALEKRQHITTFEKRVSELASLVAERNSSLPFTIIWTSLTDVMPDHSYVQTLTLKGRDLTLTGVSAKPEALLSKLEESSQFKDVRFVSPLVATPGSENVQFTIAANIESVAR